MSKAKKIFGGVVGIASVMGCGVAFWQLVYGNHPIWCWGLIVFVAVTAIGGHLLYVSGLKTDHTKELEEKESKIEEILDRENRVLLEHEAELNELEQRAEAALSELLRQAGIWMHQIAHDIRDYSDKLAFYNEKETLTKDHLYDNAKEATKSVANSLQKLFTYYVKETVCFSVKTIRKTKNKEIAITLCRSDRSDDERKLGDEHVIGPENTAFHKIRSGEERFFGKSDLIAEANAGNYSNTNPSWRNQYKCAIVVPIRKTNLDKTKSSEEFILLGFLAADANKIGALSEKMIRAYATMMMAAGDGLYRYLETVTELERTVPKG